MKKTILLLVFALFSILKTKAQITENITIDIGSISSTDSIIKPHMLGVIAGPAANYNNLVVPDLTSRYQDIGVTTVRNNDYFDDRLDMERMFFCGNYGSIPDTSTAYPNWNCDPNDTTNYHFVESDIQFQNWLDGGFVPFFRLGGENSHNIHQHDYKGPRANEEANWLKAGLKVVNRYNNFEGGSNTLQGYLNLWTEYPQNNFWDRDSVEFNNFWCTNFDSLKTNFPTLKIGGPGFNSSVSIQIGNTINANISDHVDLFLRELYGRGLKPDWIGFHVFSNTINDFYNSAVRYRKLLRAEPPFTSYTSVWGNGNNSFFDGVELICDAWGFDNDQTLPASTRDSLFNKQRGAAHHTGAFIALQQADIERAYIYRGGEFGSDITLGVMGLFQGDANAAYKPVAYGFKQCSKMQTIYNKKLISPVSAIASNGGVIWTLAGEDVDGNKALLLSNPTSNTINVSLTLNSASLTTSMYPYVNQYTVTDANDGQTPAPWTSGVFVLPPYTSNLITMTTTAVGINTPNNKPLITLYPNPSNNTVAFSEILQDIEVYNLFGQLVLPKIKSAKSISVQALTNGIYFIHANNTILKFTVEH
ncbi:MAG: T9SS type A sorting domain-containing protein [Bacteroidota bacterium]